MSGVTRPSVPVLQFLGATGTVTGSRFLLDTPRARVLIDCGLYQGRKELRARNWAPFPVDPASIDAVLLTHAHVDHSGYLPALGRHGFRGFVVSTVRTAELCAILLPDSAHLQEEEAAYANRVGYSKHHPACPLFTRDDARAILEAFRPVAFGAPVEVADGVRALFRPAGHILGSASIRIEVDGASPRSILVSGDLGRPFHPLLVPPAPPLPADAILVESTYGDRQHDESRALEALASVLSRTAERGGVAVIPAFAVDRTEVVLHQLKRLRAEGRIPPLPVYADSPMALSALGVYRRAIAAGDLEIRPDLRGAPDPFDPGDLREARDVESSKAISSERGPAIIISASGMATGGRVLHHLAARLPDPRNAVILVGFQAEGTRGGRLLGGAANLKMLGRYVPVRAEIVDLCALSVHADRQEILDWLRPTEAPAVAYVVHGEASAARSLCDGVVGELGWNAVVPGHLERVQIEPAGAGGGRRCFG